MNLEVSIPSLEGEERPLTTYNDPPSQPKAGSTPPVHSGELCFDLEALGLKDGPKTLTGEASVGPREKKDILPPRDPPKVRPTLLPARCIRSLQGLIVSPVIFSSVIGWAVDPCG
ncbi:uncharacterized protein LOC115899061 [Rhinopithecus roxellana]|uniref:uncharacterized protein LOC115899061 n=1 Tax=Rhinopithecus roxellana TaxID=61622 RepID=UPI00123750E7|nr:uncharacterized protein LOC115899061 [Rhinopithecus roxellana]